MAYLKCKHSSRIRTNKKGVFIYDLKKHHGEVEDCIIFGISHLLQVSRSCFMPLWKTVQSFIVSQFRLLFNVVLNRKLFHLADLMNFNSGIVFLIILLLLLGYFRGQAGKYMVKIKNGIRKIFIYR